jgi:hypothetical protein
MATRSTRARTALFGGALAALVAVGACANQAATRRPAPRNVEDVPMPAPKTPETQAATPAKKPATAAATKPRATPTLRTQAIADTAAASVVLRRCLARKLLPEEEATVDAIKDLLRQARAALRLANNESAASYARSARQLSRSLRCP